MKWKHKCDLGWLRMRQQWLTASEIRELVPVTKTGRPRKIGEESYLKILAKKQVNLTEDDCWSFGPAARGHMLEPFAVKMYDNEFDDVVLHHWDDAIVYNPDTGLAFSPDACDIKQPDSGIAFSNGNLDITGIGEIKSYAPDHHLQCGYSNPKDLEERWQIAAAMAVCPDIESARLIFYNPSMMEQLFVFWYKPEDLQEEIKLINKAAEGWHEFIGNLKFDENGGRSRVLGVNTAEQNIIVQLEHEQDLNPV